MRMTRDEILSELRAILLSADEKKASLLELCQESTKLIDDLGLSSIGILYLVIAIEETFDIVFDNVGMSDFVTIGNVIDYIEVKQK